MASKAKNKKIYFLLSKFRKESLNSDSQQFQP